MDAPVREEQNDEGWQNKKIVGKIRLLVTSRTVGHLE